MKRCQLTLFGGVSLRTGDGVVLVLPTRKDRQLLAFLAMESGRPHLREKLANLLWSDRAEPQARDSLRQSLAALRQAFRSVGAEVINADRMSVALDSQALSADAIDFVAGCAAAAPISALASLYRGPFLEGFEASTPDFEHWLRQERQRMDSLAERSLVAASLTDISADDAEAAMVLGRRLLAQDRILESVYRAMMRVCHARGQRALALKIYADCGVALKEDLNVLPDHETETLYRDILTDRPAVPALVPEAERRAVAAHPSIAVLPFKNLTGNDGLEFLCDGLAEDISTGLGRFRSMFVIDRYSASAVASSTTDTVDIGNRLGVSLLVQGSLQAAKSRLRITVRLVHAASRAQAWSDVFECDVEDAPGIPEKIAAAIITTVQNRVENAIVEQSPAKPSMAAYEYTLRGIKHLRGYAPDDNDQALAMFRAALDLDPDYALARAYQAFAEIVVASFDAAPQTLLIDCKGRIDDALAIDPDDGRIHWLLGTVHGYLRELADERRKYERALVLNPYDANTLISFGALVAAEGNPDEGIAMIREAMRLNPYHSDWYWLSLGAAFLSARRYADAIEAYKRRTRPKVWVLSRMAACYAHLGLNGEAQEVAREILRQNPAFTISGQRRAGWSDEILALLHEGMRKAGLPF